MIRNPVLRGVLAAALALTILILAFPRVTWRSPASDTLYVNFFSENVSIKFPGASPRPNTACAIHIYPVWAVGGMKTIHEESGDMLLPTTFHAGPSWGHAIAEFLLLLVGLFFLLGVGRRTQSGDLTSAEQSHAEAN